MNAPEASTRLTVGLGSPHGDDQAGWLAIDALARQGAAAGTLRKAADPTELLDWVAPDTELTMIDACDRCGSIGDICRFEWPTDRLDGDGLRTTHGLSLSEVLATAHRLGTGPARATIWAISGEAFVPSSAPSEDVVLAARRLAAQIAKEVEHA